MFIYGPSGCGKTTFTMDCLKYFTETQTGSRVLSPIYIDCVEFYSEKLISTYLSIYLDNIFKKIFREVSNY